MVLHIDFTNPFISEGPPDPPTHPTFHFRAVCVSTDLANHLISKSWVFDPVRRLQLHGHNDEKKKKMCRMLLCVSITYNSVFLSHQYEERKDITAVVRLKEMRVTWFRSFKELVCSLARLLYICSTYFNKMTM